MKNPSGYRVGDESARSGYRPLLLAVSALVLLSLSVTAPQAQQKTDQAPLRVYGNMAVLEMAPILRAAETSKNVTTHQGGVANLYLSDTPAPNAKGETYGTTTAPFNAGHADVSGNAETQALRQGALHPDVRILMTLVAGDYRVIAKKSSGINSIADLKGKKIGTFMTTSAAFFLNRVLAKAGLSEGDVTVVQVSPKDGPTKLKDGSIDAFAMYEPEPENAMKVLGTDALEIPNGGVYYEHYDIETTAAALADPVKHAQIVAYTRELLKACKEASTSPDRMITLISQSSKYDEKLIHDVWKHHRFLCAIPADHLDVLEIEDQWLAKLEKRAARPRAELAKMLDSSIVEEAKKAP